MIILHLEHPRAAAPAYARERRARGLPALKAKVEFEPGVSGPVVVELKGRLYTLYQGGQPCPAR